MVYCRYEDEEPDSRIVGLGAIGRALTNRRWGEALNSLAARARGGAGPREPLVATYPAPPPEIVPVALPGEPVAVPPPAVFDRHAPDAAKRWRAFAEGIEQ